MNKLTRFVRGIFILPIRFYQKHISPYKVRCCRFVPSCSAYAVEAIQKRGVIVGLFLAVRRLLRCNPLCRQCGYDPVPEKPRRKRRMNPEKQENH